MKSIFEHNQTKVVLCDNSLSDCNKIKALSTKFNFSDAYFTPGGSIKDNYYSVFDNLNSQYFCIFHDDDIVHFTDENVDDLISVLSQNLNKNILHLISSLSISENLMYVSVPKREIVKPYALHSIPYRNPFYPAWIYPNNNQTINEWHKCINAIGHYRLARKYSDVFLLQKLLEDTGYEYSSVPGLYFHIHHQTNDGAKLDIQAKLYLVLFTFLKSDFKQRIAYIMTLVLVSLKYMINKLYLISMESDTGR